MFEQISIRAYLRTLAAGALWSGVLAFGAMAQPAAPAGIASGTVSVTLTQFKVVEADGGGEQLVDASTLRPGDVIEYRATYTNHTGAVVNGLVGDLPIPEGLAYVPRSAKPGAGLVKAAAKDGAFAAEPLLRKGVGSNAAEPLPYAEYRALRWSLGRLPVNGVAAVTARAKVEPSVPPVATR